MKFSLRSCSVIAAVTLCSLPAVSAPAQDGMSQAGSTAQQGDDQKSPEQLLRDFLHYLAIARPELAAANGQALLDSGLSNAELAELIDEEDLAEKFEKEIARGARKLPGISDLVSQFESRVESGRLDLARDTDRIAEAIQMLTGQLRHRYIARRRLNAAGEYAVPQLLEVVVARNNPNLEIAATEMLIQIGRPAVTPLAEALADLDPPSARRISDILREIGYPHAQPYLLALAQSTNNGEVRKAAMRAYRSLGGSSENISTAFANLAMRYFNGEQSLIASPQEPNNNVWSYDPFTTLVPQPVTTEIFNEVMAMRLARRSLQAEPNNSRALAIYVASNLKRENELPEGEVDPIFGESQYSPIFFATASGTSIEQRVLAMAIDRNDTPLVGDAIEALSKTAGSSNLFEGVSGRQPLLEALDYPERRVRYDAALTLGSALPSRSFSADFRVVPILASAVRSGNESFAIVIAGPENRTVEAGKLRNLDFTVLNGGRTFDEVRNELDQATGIDLIVVRGSSSRTIDTIEQIRSNPRTSVTPVLAIASGTDKVDLSREYSDDPRVEVILAGIEPEAFSNAVDNLLRRASGGRMTEAESQVYAIEALNTLQDIAISGSQVYNIADAENALLNALDTRSGGVRMLVADVLARIDSEQSQQKLFTAALAASDQTQVKLLERVAASAKRFGNLAQQRHIQALLDLVKNSTGQVADAAAEVHGALDLPASNAVQLITE